MVALQDTPRSFPPSDGPPLALVAALASNGVIGRDNALPWHLPADLRHFREKTMGHSVLMGRKTWEAIGRPLPGRQNVVITRRADFRADGAERAGSLDDALALARMPAPACCIGGEEIFRLALPRATVMYLTEIDHPFEGDARFPAFDRSQWRETSRENHPPGAHGDFGYAFVTLERR